MDELLSRGISLPLIEISDFDIEEEMVIRGLNKESSLMDFSDEELERELEERRGNPTQTLSRLLHFVSLNLHDHAREEFEELLRSGELKTI